MIPKLLAGLTSMQCSISCLYFWPLMTLEDTICTFLFWTLTSIGMVFDKSSLAWASEFLRSAVFLILYVKMGAWNEFMIPYEMLIGTFTVSLIISFANIVVR